MRNQFKKIKLLAASFLLISAIAIAFFFPTSCNLHNSNSSSNDTIVTIGAILPLSGNASSIGEYCRLGLDYAVFEQNKKGGLLGKKIVLDVQDSKGEAKEGINIIKRMLSFDKKPFLVYTIISGVTLSVKQETEKNKVLLLSAVASDQLLKDSKFTFRNFISPSIIGSTIANYIKDSLKVADTGIFYVNNDAGRSFKTSFEYSCIGFSLKLNFSEPYEEKALDFKNLISKNINKDTKAIYVAGLGQSIGILVKQIRESGFKGFIIGDPNIINPSALNVAGDAMNGLYYLNFNFDTSSQNNKIKPFINEFQNRYNKAPENFAIIAFEGLNLFFQEIEQLKSLDSQIIVDSVNNNSFNGLFGEMETKNFDILYNLKIFKMDDKR